MVGTHTSVPRRRPTGRLAVALALVVALGASLLAPAPVGAAGVTTHGWMAVEAIGLVDDPSLNALLLTHQDQVRAGAMFPDAGYVGTNTFGEEAHWQRFVDAYVDQIRSRDDCGDVTDPAGPCADMVAHLMGVAAHGMGDEVWDWLFEPYSPDLDEYYTDPGLATSNEGGAEVQMDLVAIGRHGVPRPEIPPLPSVDALLAAFSAAGFEGVTASQLDLAGIGEVIWDYEAAMVPQHLPAIEAAMPWMSSNIVTAPGGVDFAARAIAGYWTSLWGRIQGTQPPTEVSVTHPAPGEALPWSGWERSFQPGSSRSGGGARQRITAVLTHALPYAPPTGGPSILRELPAGTMTIVHVDTGAPVELMAGYPRSVPYGGEAGQHLVDVQPAEDLEPCSTYEVAVGVTTPLLDARGTTIAPHTWRFTTECVPQVEVSGTVTGPDGNGVADVLVLFYRSTDGFMPSWATATGPDGTYVTTPPEGEYVVYFVPPAGSGLARIWSGQTRWRAMADPVLVPHDAPQVADAWLAASAGVTGRVTTGDGTGVGGVAVSAYAPTDRWVPTARAVTGADGTYALTDLPSGEYAVGFRAPIDNRLRWYDQAPVRHSATPVAVVGGATVDGIDHVLIEPAG